VNKEAIWMASSGEGLYYYDHNRLHNLSTREGLPSNDIDDLIIDRHGNLWIATDNGVAKIKYSPDEFLEVQLYGKNEGLSDPLTTCLSYHKASDLLIAGTHNSGLFKLQDGQFIEIRGTKNFEYIQNLHFASPNEIMVYANEPVLSVINIKDNVTYEELPVTAKSILPARFTREGFIWLQPENRRLIQMSSHFKKYETPQTPQSILCIKDTIFMGTANGLFLGTKHEKMMKWIPISGLKGQNIISLEIDGRHLLIGTFGNGLFRYKLDTEKTERYGMKDGLTDESILDIYNDGNFIWLGTLGGLIKTSWKSSQLISTQTLVDTVYVYHIEKMNENLYFSTHGDGAGRIVDNQVKWFQDTVLSTGEISTFALLPPDQGLFVTTRMGLIHKSNGNIYPVHTPSNISIDNTSAIAADRKSHRFFISHANGLDIFNPADSSVIHLGNNMGLNFTTSALNAYCFDSINNTHLFGTADGFYSLTSNIYKNRQSPELEILNIWVNNQLISSESLKDLDSDQHTLQLELLSKWYTDPEAVNYRYKIEGFHEAWISTSDQKIVFPELPYGNYTLKLKAALYDEINSGDQLAIPINIAYPLWLRPWFIFLIAILIIAVIYGYVKNREMKLERWAKLEREKANAQIQALKSQVSPHFMFNSFNTLIALIEEAPDKAAEYAEQLSDFFRSLLGKRKQELSSLKDEVEMANAYISLLKTRYGENLRVDIHISDWEGYIVTYTLQILTENIIKHNVISRDQPLHFSIRRKGDHLIIRNDLQEKYRREKSTGFGLESVKDRYKIIFKKEIEVSKDDKHFTVRIPIIKKREL
jgi:hypothetical protein